MQSHVINWVPLTSALFEFYFLSPLRFCLLAIVIQTDRQTECYDLKNGFTVSKTTNLNIFVECANTAVVCHRSTCYAIKQNEFEVEKNQILFFGICYLHII